MAEHAKVRPPSAAHRWIACPGSASVVQLYDRDESDASVKGDEAHAALEAALVFGVKPHHDDPDVNDNVTLALEWVQQQRILLGAQCQVYAEIRLDIPETGEFGTADIVLVTPELLHVGDYKNGYVRVDVRDPNGSPNEQLMTYLCGAIAKFGARPKYVITIIQPNASHIDGPIRTTEVTGWEVLQHSCSIADSIAAPDVFKAGAHCKKTYCQHRGACTTFLNWVQTEPEANGAWYPSEINAVTDDQLARLLDHADTLQGLRDELRKEALRRIMQMDREIPGYKVVQGRRDRQIINEPGVKAKLLELGATDDEMYEARKLVSAAGVERYAKKYAQRFGLPRGGWKQVYDNVFGEYIREYSGGLTLERATDGRPAHKRGSEFGPIPAPGTTQTHTV